MRNAFCLSFFLLLFTISLTSCKSESSPLDGLNKMTKEEAGQAPISISSKTPSYTEEGEKIKVKDWGNYAADESYSREFYVDEKGNIKAVVFIKNPPQTTEKSAEPAPPILSFEGKTAPDMLMTDMNGNSLSLASLRGKIVVLNFWFIACKPCVAEMPALNEVKASFPEKDVVFIGVTFDKKQSVESFLKKHNFSYTIIPEARNFLDLWDANIFPSNIVIDKDGVVRLHQFGYNKDIEPILKANIDRLL